MNVTTVVGVGPFHHRLSSVVLACSICLFALIFSPTAISLDCSSENIELADQADVNLFQQAYGAGGVCDTVTGYLDIYDGPGTDITDLSPLSGLREVRGNLTVESNDELLTLKGLEGIIRVGGDLQISYNGQLSECSAIYGLITADPTSFAGVSGGIYISSNASGCSSVSQIVDATRYELEACPVIGYNDTGEVAIYTVETQDDVENLRQLLGGTCNSLGGVLNIGRTWTGGGSTDITDLRALSWIKHVDALAVDDNPYLYSLSGLDNLVGGIQFIYLWLTPINTLDPLGDIERITRYDEIYYDGLIAFGTNLRTLSPLADLSVDGSLYPRWDLVGNPVLASCEWPADFYPSVDLFFNSVGCNSQDEIIEYWGLPRFSLTPTVSPELGLSPGGGVLYLNNTSMLNYASYLFAGSPPVYVVGSTGSVSIPVPEGAGYSIPLYASEASFVTDCQGGYSESEQAFVMDPFSKDCSFDASLKVDLAAEEVPGSLVQPGTACKAVTPGAKEKIEWRDNGVINMSDASVDVVCPLMRSSYLTESDRYLDDINAYVTVMSLEGTPEDDIRCSQSMSGPSPDFVVEPYDPQFWVHRRSLLYGETTVKLTDYVDSVAASFSIECTLPPGTGISGLRVDSY